ncbi:IS66 family insertion sequence hypothetical protein [Verminephrobacter eiseniae]|nr:IS66 family insertion sequence hypothetical protein [Verminephrobacter eiseniae]
MNTFSDQTVNGRRRRRVHSDEFKANVVAALPPGMSMAAVAMANGINANLLRRWVRTAEIPSAGNLPNAALPSHKRPVTQIPSAAFVPMQLPAPTPAADIRIELRRGATTISVNWPVDAAPACAAWMRELLR